jgi:hypothetical protein
MSPLTAAVNPPSAPFAVYSIHFAFLGSQAIEMLDHRTNLPIGATPEWEIGKRNELAAYVRRTRPDLRVVFKGTPAANGNYTVGADGTPLQVAEKVISLAFDPSTGLSNPEVFTARNDLPDVIGVHDAQLHWYLRERPAPASCPAAGISMHRIATSWRPVASSPVGENPLPRQVFKPLIEWTCHWAAGLGDEKAICDAIIKNLPNTTLRYGVPGSRDVRDLLLNDGGMCGVWYKTFQQMAQCQGVFVYRRRFLVDLRRLARGEVHWNAIVIKTGGLNRTEPNAPESTFHDNDGTFPIPAGTDVLISRRHERRYRFYSLPGYIADGHCINFLLYNGKVYLYDACFAIGPLEIQSPLPVVNLLAAQGGAGLAEFRRAYLDGAVDYMLGSLWNGPDFLETIVRYPPYQNGMTVRTANIPETVNGNHGLSFYWGD